ncbi:MULTISPECIES: type VI secretion system Vgr family protein [Pseudomonas]|uniref:type VI secretion system Vgr family protein n=1 Tax=Pseudomonas TaxID=286 RepID=UPI0007613464|nr:MULTISPECIES: type VI secretion system tip protein TssI/VgrG [Pseudomonas]ANI35052.1 type VI secretion protein VgrG [Pseudomonas sp. JY-Q]MDN5522653.1 type VI secretion system tip protein VgrG [Pseudomonas sp.]MDN5534456.1 type VI secretion system tip protein VgrG [Pseudomonas sp.]OUS82213.1 type VI secretion protein VgrG [Pseudomonas putida]OUS88163.1 type VI secretion protein VgrG [Pseudomonas putida]
MPSQSDLRYSFEALVGNAEFEVVSFELREGISTPFELELKLISFENDIDFGHLLDKPVLFTIWEGGRPVRYVHGLVSRFSQAESGFYRTYYDALIEPQLARASLRSNWRIFQQKTVPQILELMLKRQGIDQYALRASLDHQVREFCVQAGETDLDFIARLAAEEGFVYRFEHNEKRHKLIITDRLQSLGLISHGVIKHEDDAEGFYREREPSATATVLYHSSHGGDQPQPCLRRLRYSEQVRTARQVQRDYTFTHPAYRQEHRASGPYLEHQSTDYECFDYPGRYKRDAVGKPFTENRITGLRHDVRIAQVQGDDVRLQPGLSFTLTGHPREDLNVHWRVSTVRHEGSQFTSLQEEAAGADQGTRYEQKAVLVPGRTEWRPAPLPKPRVDGPHMATVVGPPGEEIYCDEWGRVKVSFPWDRESQDNAFSSCWVRVSQGWAGGSWGSMAIPRIGQDVIIHYVNGDPDQPMITGRTYCGNQLPPYDLPRHKTRMTIKSQTHKGDGFNELRFEDELGQEEVFIHAQRDQNNVVKHDETTQVGNDRKEQVDHDESILIGHDRTETVGNDEHITIGQDAALDIGRNHTIRIAKDRVENIGNHRHDQIAANHHTLIGGNFEQRVEGHAELEARGDIRRRTRRYELRASEAVVIQGPGGSIRIDETGITLDSPTIRITGQMLKSANGTTSPFSISSAPNTGKPLERLCGRRPDGTCPLPDCRCIRGPGQ